MLHKKPPNKNQLIHEHISTKFHLLQSKATPFSDTTGVICRKFISPSLNINASEGGYGILKLQKSFSSDKHETFFYDLRSNFEIDCELERQIWYHLHSPSPHLSFTSESRLGTFSTAVKSMTSCWVFGSNLLKFWNKKNISKNKRASFKLYYLSPLSKSTLMGLFMTKKHKVNGYWLEITQSNHFRKPIL